MEAVLFGHSRDPSHTEATPGRSPWEQGFSALGVREARIRELAIGLFPVS